MNDLLNQWRKRFEEMQVQFSLGKMDAVESFEKQKEMMREAIQGWKESLNKGATQTDAQINTFKGKMEELMLQLNLGKADGMDAFNAQRKKIEEALESLKVEAKATGDKQFDDMMHWFEAGSKTFKTGLEIAQLQFSLGKMEAKDNYAEISKEIADKVKELTNSMEEWQKTGIQQLNQWTQQMQEGYEKMKSFSEDWLKKNR